MTELTVHIQRHDHSYRILVDEFFPDAWLAAVEDGVRSDRHVAVVDERVGGLYGLEEIVGRRAGWLYAPIGAGEGRKTVADYVGLCDRLLGMGIDRNTVLVAVGGGVVGDIVGFAAATLLRGLRFAQVPTTLLAQVDSSVGGKTGVNMAGGKNLLGAFHQPALVLADPGVLATLGRRDYLSGLAEVAKYGALGDRDFFLRLVASAGKAGARDREFLAGAVAHCCAMKARIVGSDEREAAARRLLNLGHTFGHALEALAGYDGSLLHGEAVSIGMALAAGYSTERGMLDKDDAAALLDGLRRLGLPVGLSELAENRAAGKADWRGALTRERLAAALAKDKKAAGGGLTLVLFEALGRAVAVPGVNALDAADFIVRYARQ